jgi:hypothetical protein
MPSIHTHVSCIIGTQVAPTLPITSDTAVTRFAPARVALAVVKVVVAMTSRDAIGIGGAFEVVVARVNDAISTDQLEARRAILDTLSVDLLVALVALAIVKVVVACATGNAARVHWADIVGALHRRTHRRSDGMIGRQADWRSDGVIGRQADGMLGRQADWRHNWLGRRRDNWLGRRRDHWLGRGRNNRLGRGWNNWLGRGRNHWLGRRRNHWLGCRRGNRCSHGCGHGRRNGWTNRRGWRWRTLGIELVDNLKARFSPDVALNLDRLFSTSRKVWHWYDVTVPQQPTRLSKLILLNTVKIELDKVTFTGGVVNLADNRVFVGIAASTHNGVRVHTSKLGLTASLEVAKGARLELGADRGGHQRSRREDREQSECSCLEHHRCKLIDFMASRGGRVVFLIRVQLAAYMLKVAIV